MIDLIYLGDITLIVTIPRWPLKHDDRHQPEAILNYQAVFYKLG